MSVNNDAQTGESTMTISADAATRVQRKAKARQSTRLDDGDVAVPTETSIGGTPDFFDKLFNEDGMAFDSWWDWKDLKDDPAWESKAGEKRRSLLNNPRDSDETAPVSPDDDPEAFLEAVAPDRLERINDQFESLPGTRDELLTYHAKKAIKEAEERGEELHVDDDTLVITKHQQDTERDIWAGVDDDEPEHDGKECPECGSTNTSSYQQQTGGADEGMTGFHSCSDCGHSWRTGYGA